jgi:CRP-like cAMP-binding protein
MAVNCGCKFSETKQVVDLPDQLKPRFLAGLAKSELDMILSAAAHKRFLANSVIVHQDDPAERFFLLSSGQGRHFVLTSGGRKILLHWLTTGQIFGGTAIVSAPFRYIASTEVLSDSCALIWDRPIMRELAYRFPILFDNTFSIVITEHLASMVAANTSLGSDDATGRIAHLLISLASGIGKVGPDGVEIHVGNDDLAAGANVTPFTVSRALSEWERKGVLTKGRGKILLRRPELLLVSNGMSSRSI